MSCGMFPCTSATRCGAPDSVQATPAMTQAAIQGNAATVHEVHFRQETRHAAVSTAQKPTSSTPPTGASASSGVSSIA